MDQSICFDGQCDGGGLHHSPEGHSLVFSLLSCHFPGDEFLVADFLSRGKVFSAEWMLNQEVFQRTCQVFLPPPEINLFFCVGTEFPVSEILCEVRRSSGMEEGSTVFSMEVSISVCLFPFSFLPRVLEKIVRDEAEVALVAFFWPRRPWFP